MRLAVLVCTAACSFPTKQLVTGDAIGSGSGSDARGDATPGRDAIPGFECRGVPLPATAPATINIHGEMVDGNGVNPVPQANVRVFAADGTSLGSATTDGNGLYTILVQTGGVPVDAHTVVNAPGYLPTGAWRSAPMAGDTDVSLALITSAEANALANAAGINNDSTRGIVVTFINDCDGRPQTGAMMPNPQPGVAIERYPVGNALPASASSTDSSGTVYLFDVGAGGTVLNATLADGMAQYPRTMQAVGGEFDYAALQPSP